MVKCIEEIYYIIDEIVKNGIKKKEKRGGNNYSTIGYSNPYFFKRRWTEERFTPKKVAILL